MHKRQGLWGSPGLSGSNALSWRETLIVFAGTLGLVSLLFHPAWSLKYAVMDEYLLLFHVPRGSWPVWGATAGAGRLLYGTLLWLGFSLPEGIVGLWKVRLLGFPGMALLVTVLFAIARRGGCGRTFSAALGQSVLLTPGFALFPVYGVCFPYPYAAAAAAWAGWCLWQASDADGQRSGRWWQLLSGVGWLTLALMVFQPAALLVLFAPFLMLWLRPDRARLRCWLFATASAAGLLAVYLLCYRLSVTVFFPETGGSGRGSLVFDPAAKLDMVWNAWIPAAFSLWGGILGPVPAALYTAGVLLLAALGVVGGVRMERGGWIRLLGLIVIAGATLAPHLIVAENQVPSRVLLLIHAGLMAAAVSGLSQLAATILPGKQWVRAGVALGWLMLHGGLASHLTGYTIAAANRAEMNAVAQVIEADFEQIPEALLYVHPSAHVPAMTPQGNRSEYGLISSWSVVEMQPFLQLLFEETLATAPGTPGHRYIRLESCRSWEWPVETDLPVLRGDLAVQGVQADGTLEKAEP